MTDVRQLTADALALSEAERQALVDRLLDSLAPTDDPEDDYSRELAARAERVRAGTARLRDWSEVEGFVAKLKGSQR